MHDTQTFDPRMDPSALDLLSTAYQLAATANQWVWLGASRNLSSPSMFQGWAWVDGTNSSNLNCGGPGCGPWTGNEPKYVPTQRGPFKGRCCRSSPADFEAHTMIEDTCSSTFSFLWAVTLVALRTR